MAHGQHASVDVGRISVVKTVLSLVAMVAAIAGLAYVFRTFVFAAFEIPSASMEETIMTGDLVFTEKVSYAFADVKRGDIITFIDQEDNSENPRMLIKRVIAVGGDKVDIRDGSVFVNGSKLQEDYTKGKRSYTSSSSTITYPYLVPKGYVWVMGDNRSNSQDSRYFGAIPLTAVQGRALLVYWPIEHFGLLS